MFRRTFLNILAVFPFFNLSKKKEKTNFFEIWHNNKKIIDADIKDFEISQKGNIIIKFYDIEIIFDKLIDFNNPFNGIISKDNAYVSFTNYNFIGFSCNFENSCCLEFSPERE